MRKKEPEVFTYGFRDVEKRKKTFVRSAKRHRERASKVVDEARVLQKQLLADALFTEELVTCLDEYYEEARKKTEIFRQSGRKRLDGKRASALISRGLTHTCGIIKSNTLVHCTKTELELKDMYWAYEWIVDLLDDLSVQVTPAEMFKFYKTIEKYQDDPDTIKSEAGLIVLGKY